MINDFFDMVILLDIDGVLVTNPIWEKVELLGDGFMKFNENARNNLIELYDVTKAKIILTTTHRISYTIDDWKLIFHKSGLFFENISKINEVTNIAEIKNRGIEIKNWVENEGKNLNYVIIDDDTSINSLENYIKERAVLTNKFIGFDKESKEMAFKILKNNSA